MIWGLSMIKKAVEQALVVLDSIHVVLVDGKNVESSAVLSSPLEAQAAESLRKQFHNNIHTLLGKYMTTSCCHSFPSLVTISCGVRVV